MPRGLQIYDFHMILVFINSLPLSVYKTSTVCPQFDGFLDPPPLCTDVIVGNSLIFSGIPRNQK